MATPKPSTAKEPVFPGTLAKARYIYVASYHVDQFDQNLLPDTGERIWLLEAKIA